MKVEITQKQLEAIHELAGTAESFLGGVGDIESKEFGLDEFDIDVKRCLKLIDRFFVKNGYPKATNL